MSCPSAGGSRELLLSPATAGNGPAVVFEEACPLLEAAAVAVVAGKLTRPDSLVAGEADGVETEDAAERGGGRDIADENKETSTDGSGGLVEADGFGSFWLEGAPTF